MTTRTPPPKLGTEPAFKDATQRLIDSVKGRTSKAIKRAPRVAAPRKRPEH